MESAAYPKHLRPALELLPEKVDELRQLGRPGQPWFVRYGSRRAILRWSDPGRFRTSSFTLELAVSSIAWLHEVLADLSTVGFVAPAPIAELGGRSIAVIEGGIAELLAFVPGELLGWPNEAELFAAGQLLAKFHHVSVTLPTRAQRPGSTPVSQSQPRVPDGQRIRAQLERELNEIGYLSQPDGVVHGDATNINTVVDAGQLRFIDFALCYREALLFDVSSALWRNGRTGPNDLSYDQARVAEFVRGYAATRSLGHRDARAIVVLMKGRGLQLQHRLELRGGTDATVLQRLLAVERQQADLEDAIIAALNRSS